MCASVYAVKAQPSVLQSSPEEEASETEAKILIIPFHSVRYYFSDCDKSIAANSKVDIRDVRKSFMMGLDYATEAKMDKDYAPLNLIQMRDSVDKETMAKVYENVSYGYEAPTRLIAAQKDQGLFGKMKAKFRKVGSKEKVPTLQEEESYTSLKSDDPKYMKLSWENPEFLESLNTVYQPDYIVTINQFEIRTDYPKCIDRELGNYTRIIKVHFNVFSPDGKQMYGDVVTAKYNSTSDDLNQIIQDNFGFLGEYITQALPAK
jgi:hypothetical protein